MKRDRNNICLPTRILLLALFTHITDLKTPKSLLTFKTADSVLERPVSFSSLAILLNSTHISYSCSYACCIIANVN